MAFREEDHPRDNDGKFTDKEGGKTYRQNVSYETILTGETTRRKPEQATGFNRLNTAHHQRHAKEMGYANLKEYEKAAVNFFNSDRGQLYYSTKWEKFYR